jgi:hypothetical protein
MDKQDEKKRLEKEATAAIYINLAKEAIEVQMLDAKAKRIDVKAKCRAEDTKIMLTDLSNMDDDHRTWFEKKQSEIH